MPLRRIFVFEDNAQSVEAHKTDSDFIHRILNWTRWGGDAAYASLQALVDDAITNHRAVELEPGKVYDLTEPLRIHNARHFHLRGNGATLRAVADMDRLVDLNGVADSTFEALDLTTAPGVTVQSMVRVRYDGEVERSTTRLYFQHIYVTGRYVNGWHIGDAARQVDVSEWRLCTCAGGWSEGEATLWQNGFLLGEGLHGNGMLTSFYSCTAYYHRRHFAVDAYRYVHIGPGCNGSISETDIWLRATRPVSIDGYRSEGGQTLVACDAGSANYPMMVTVENCGFHPGDGVGITMPEGGAVMYANHGGVLRVNNLAVQPTPANAVLLHTEGLQQPLAAAFSEIVMENIDPANRFDVDENTTVNETNPVVINEVGRIIP